MIHPNCYHDHSDISGDELPLTTSNERNGVKIRLGPSRFAALPPVTIIETLDRIVGKYGEKPALHQKQFPPGKLSKDTPWKTWTWKEYQSISYMFAKSLIFLDLQPFDTVTIVGFNAPEWIFANIGAIAAGGIAAGIYATETPDRCKCICTYSKARVAVVGGIDQLNKFVEIASDLPFLMAIVIYGGDTVPECLQHKCVVPIYCFDVFLELGMRVSDSHLRELTSLQKPNHVCMLSFTSGTTGPAKACMITHDNVTWTSKAILATLPRRVDERDCAVSYLPLANSSAQVMNLYIPLLSGSQTFFVQRGAVLSSVFETLREVRPSVFLGPPRVWERICSKLKESEASGMRGKALQWAKEKALRHHASKQYKSNVSSPLLYPLAKLLLHRLRVMIGLDRCMVAYCSSSPISLGTLEYFASLDIPIYEVYGQTECTGPHTANSPGRAWKMGTSGRPLLGTESKIDDSGEVCFRGRHVFAGYLRMEETTAATIDSEGWLHSGDMGYFDKDDDPRVAPPSGFLTITGRIKEEITIDTGEIVLPVSIEQNILDAMPAVANCMVVGDGCHFLSVLLCLFTDVSDCSGPTNKLIGKSLEASRAIGSTATTPVEAQRCEKWNEYFKKGIQVANQKATAQANSVRKWEVVPVKFSIEGGELTPTLKLKRKYTEAKYSSLVEALYS